ncbi:universal stress protein [Halospeciosus flavus]|uniref:Universal stress protein n=1 Tax=Halospeciosus flavus TaxID=3032283 RepID=A0ABD5Z128_9EURY|nr:universal stress protein [Halospeciosus flavus]
MYEDMLIPYDGSEEGTKGVEHGLDLAAELDSTVHALYVVDLPGAPRALSLRDDEETIREEYEAYGEEVLDEVRERAVDRGLDCETVIRSGPVSDRIVEYAETEGMDVVVMGSAYRGKIGNLLGGTTNKVVRSTTVPVVSKRMEASEL